MCNDNNINVIIVMCNNVLILLILLMKSIINISNIILM